MKTPLIFLDIDGVPRPRNRRAARDLVGVAETSRMVCR